MPGCQGGIDHEIGALQALGAVERLFKVDVHAQLFGITAADVITAFQALQVDIHEADRATFQVFGQANISDQRQRESTTSRTDQADFDVHTTLRW